MNQRRIAAMVAAPLVLALVVLAAVLPLPFATYEPGSTFDVLAESDGEEIIQVEGRPAYHGDGELRMTTVLVSVPQQRKNLFEVLGAWWDDDAAVYPYEAIYDQDQTAEQTEREGQVEMVSSQDAATAVALRELDYDVPERLQVTGVEEDAPAEGRLETGDVLVRADGEPVSTGEDLVATIQATEPGEPVSLAVRRGESTRTVEVTPEDADGEGPRIGVSLGYGYDLPIDVTVDVDPAIGGPSAGLVFALAIYDTLTPDSLTDGRSVAGTGTVDANGAVGPIGGIAQKIAGARADGAALFLVPPANCEAALTADAGDMRLVRASTMHDARVALQAWAEDPDTELPSCEAA